MTETEAKIMKWDAALKRKKVIYDLVTFVLGYPYLVWSAFVIWKLYGWFAVPVGMPSLGYWNAFGIILFMALLHWHFVASPTKEVTLKRIYDAALVHLVVFGLGALVNQLAF